MASTMIEPIRHYIAIAPEAERVDLQAPWLAAVHAVVHVERAGTLITFTETEPPLHLQLRTEPSVLAGSIHARRHGRLAWLAAIGGRALRTAWASELGRWDVFGQHRPFAFAMNAEVDWIERRIDPWASFVPGMAARAQASLRAEPSLQVALAGALQACVDAIRDRPGPHEDTTNREQQALESAEQALTRNAAKQAELVAWRDKDPLNARRLQLLARLEAYLAASKRGALARNDADAAAVLTNIGMHLTLIRGRDAA